MVTTKPAACTALRNILLPTDFSDASIRALPYAAAIARQHKSTLHVAHVIESRKRPRLVESDILAGEVEPEAYAIARRNLHAFLQTELVDGIRCHTALREGTLWEGVATLLNDCGIDLVVVGTRAAGGFTRVMLGSGAEQIFREACCPVMTIGPHASSQPPGSFKKILFAMDLTESSKQVLPYALSFAAGSQAELTVLHAVEPLIGGEFAPGALVENAQQVRSLLLRELEQMSGSAEHKGVPNVIIEGGAPAAIILQCARHLQADLIIAGIHHARRLATHMPWTLAHEVVSEAACPVLTIRT